MTKAVKKTLIISAIVGTILFVSIVVILVKGIQRYSTNKNTETYTSSYYEMEDSSDSLLIEKSVVKGDSGAEEISVDENTSTEKKVIKTGSVSVEVKDIPETIKTVNALVIKYKGSITSESDSGDGVDRTVYITVKVDQENYLQAYNELKELEGKLVYSSSYLQDVTEEYVDLNARLTNLEATEAQLVKILETAESVEDTLAVYSELSDVRGDIESLEGRIKYLNEQTDFSTISLTISQSTTGITIGDEKWEPLGVVKSALNALVEFAKGIVNALIWIVVFSPVVIIPVLIVVLILKKKGKK